MEKTREYMLEIIQREISDKTLSPGYVYENLGHKQEILLEHRYEDIEYDVRDQQINEIVRVNRNTIILATNHNIGHPVMIGDVLDWIHNHKRDGEYNNDMSIADFVNYIDSYQYGVIIRYIEARKPIQEQSDECIRYIYSLLPLEVRK